MYKQLEYLRESKGITRNTTFRIDLPESGMLSALMLRFDADAVSGATATNKNWRLIDHITKIEIIANGATVVKSYTGFQLQYIFYLSQGIVPPHFWRNYATNTQMEYLPILFGRFLNDPEFGLDLSKFDNVELRITNTGSSTFYGGDLRLSIVQSYLRDAPGGFQGYIRSEEWRKWTTAQNGIEYFTLPTEYPISGLYLRALPANTNGVMDTGFYNLMWDLDLSIGGGQKQLYKAGLDDLIVMNYIEKGFELFTSGQVYGTADYGKDVGIGRIFGWSGISGSKDGAVSSVIPTIEADLSNSVLKPEAYEGDSPISFLFRGMAYHNCAFLTHAPNLEPDLMLNPAEVGDIRLNVQTRDSSSAASGENSIFLDRVVV